MGIIKLTFISIIFITSILYIKLKGFTEYFRSLLKIAAPLVIIAFYLWDISLTKGVESLLNFSIPILESNMSARIAVDSAVVTLLINFFAFLINSPATIDVSIRNRMDTEGLIIYNNKPVNLDIQVNYNFRYKWLGKVLLKFGMIKLHIKNTKWTSIDIENRADYDNGIIDFSNPSKYIDINLKDLITESPGNRKLYFQLIVQSNKEIKRDGEISVSIEGSLGLRMLHNILIKTSADKQSIFYRKLI